MFDNIPAYYNVKLSKIMEPLKLTLLNKEVDVDKVELHQSDVNRPALQLAGFFEHFDSFIQQKFAAFKIIQAKTSR